MGAPVRNADLRVHLSSRAARLLEPAVSPGCPVQRSPRAGGGSCSPLHLREETRPWQPLPAPRTDDVAGLRCLADGPRGISVIREGLGSAQELRTAPCGHPAGNHPTGICASGKGPAEEVLIERRGASWVLAVGLLPGQCHSSDTLSAQRWRGRGPPAVCAAAGDCLLWQGHRKC